MNKNDLPSEEAIRKLPQWAQKYIKNIEQERDVSIRALNEHLDQQTKSKIYWDQYVCTGENKEGGPSSKRFYVQSDRVVVESCGVQLQVSCHDGSSMHDPGVDLQWSDNQGVGNHIALVPKSFQQAVLIAHHNMRVHAQATVAAACARKGHEFHDVKRCAHCGYVR
jgi:hypothetical protein